MSDIRDRRAAENENFFRRINERVELLSEGLPDLSLVCECADPSCVERLPEVAVNEYEEVRAHGARFLIAPGHERPDVESVVDEREGYIVVEKRGDAGEIARDEDPRAD